MLKRILSKKRMKKAKTDDSPKPRKKDYVEVDDTSVKRFFPDGRVEEVRWEHLAEVGIVTTDEGPIMDDCYWMLIEEDGKTGCAVPLGDPEFKIILERVQKLPDFDNEMFIKAMSSALNNKFACWKKDKSRSIFF